MPKIRKETVDKIKRLSIEGYTNTEISEKLGVSRGTARKYRVDADESTVKEGTFFSLVDKLSRLQGAESREDALLRAIDTQVKFNPYILNHHFETPGDLITFFEDKSKKDDEAFEELLEDYISIFDKYIALRDRSMLECLVDFGFDKDLVSYFKKAKHDGYEYGLMDFINGCIIGYYEESKFY